MPSAVDQKALDSVEHKPELTHLDLPPTLDEVKKAIGQTSCGKAPGTDGIPADLYKAVGPEAIEDDATQRCYCCLPNQQQRQQGGLWKLLWHLPAQHR